MDLTAEIEPLWAAVGTSPGQGSRVVQIIAARAGEGSSTVSRSLAYLAAVKLGLRVWLVDMDLAGAEHTRFFAGSDRPGTQLGPPQKASPDGQMFFAVRPQIETRDGVVRPDVDYMEARRVGDHPWWVTRFRTELLRGPQRVHVLPEPHYWDRMRSHCDLVIVDCLPPAASQAGVMVSPFMDHTVLVVSSDQNDVRPPGLLRNAIHAARGKCSGVFFNKMTLKPPRFLPLEST